jgi:hypothetical protein
MNEIGYKSIQRLFQIKRELGKYLGDYDEHILV